MSLIDEQIKRKPDCTGCGLKEWGICLMNDGKFYCGNCVDKIMAAERKIRLEIFEKAKTEALK